ncbi:MAG: DNA integrity scanning diadenylate cyclase DisA [Actinobacteria bacterium]|nr:DNA integrity scanning diadenylate cyclase DisA [Actinomycetota bacterium]MCL5447332.1 DNA integrity scanning diadenylate cyclase DisA [Actinomycetota bacterium]
MTSGNSAPEPLDALPLLAVGMPVREGLERVVQAHRGALVVMSDGEEVLALCSGGFLLNAEFSPQRLAELAKMDGAIVLSKDASRIARANVHLVPNHSIPTSETGTRHRTAERVARSTGVPVVSVSTAMGVITLYEGTRKHVLRDGRHLSNQASQVIQTLARFRQRFDAAVSSLSALELEDAVTMRDVALAVQPAELVCRLAAEVNGYLIELGEDGRLLKLQLDELAAGVEATRDLIVRDYMHMMSKDGAGAGMQPPAAHHHGHLETDRERKSGPKQPVVRLLDGSGVPSIGRGSRNAPTHAASNGTWDRALQILQNLDTEELANLDTLTEAIGIQVESDQVDGSVGPKGYRLLHRLPNLPEPVIDRIVEHFGSLQAIMRASQKSLEEVEGVGVGRATSLRNGLARLAESSILERYE